VRGARRVDAMGVVPGSRRLVAVVLAAVAVAMLAITARADAFIYWASATNLSGGTPPGNSIGRANHVNGLNVNNTFITGTNNPSDVAVDPNFIYWTNPGAPPTFGTTIGRAPITGAPTINQSFITGANVPAGVAVDPTFIYWTNSGTRAAPGTTIGRADINGTPSSVNQSFITGANDPTGIAVDSNFIYWANTGTNTIGRANLNGTGANPSFITGANLPTGIEVDGSFIYWVNSGSSPNTIGRANLNGTSPNPDFITVNGFSSGVAVDNTYIYWSNSGTMPGTIGRANKTSPAGTINQSFVTGLFAPQGLAVNALLPLGSPPPTTTVADLMTRVQRLGLPHGIERSLLAQLGAAQQGGACANLRAFTNHVKAQSGKKIAADDAADLLAETLAVGDSLGCGGG
jgi:virginiamycin B lyase